MLAVEHKDIIRRNVTEHHPVWDPAQGKCTQQTTKNILKKKEFWCLLNLDSQKEAPI